MLYDKLANDKKSLYKILICPDCRKEISYRAKNLECMNCGRRFTSINGIINLLPSHLEKNKKNEDHLHRMEDLNPKQFSRINKKRDYRFFKEEFFPKYTPVGKTVLEIGAGTCWVSSIIKSKAPWIRMIASDVSPYALLKGRVVSSLLGSKVDHFLACDVEKLPFRDGTLEAVIGVSMLHHLTNPQKGALEIYRVLTEGGKVFIIDFALANILKNRLVMSVLCSDQTCWGITHAEYKIVEGFYDYGEWQNLFSSAGFRKTVMCLEPNYYTDAPVIEGFNKDSKKLFHTIFYGTLPYYSRLISFLPNHIVRSFMASGISIIAEK